MRIVSADDAVSLLRDGDTLMIGGSGGGHAVPEALLEAVERRFQQQGSPRRLNALHPVGLGDRGQRGASRLAHPGLLKRVVCGTLVDSPALAQLALANEIEAWTLPQGVLSQLTREMAAGRPGLISHVGLHTFVDPRLGGGRQSERCHEELVSLIEIGGREWLHCSGETPRSARHAAGQECQDTGDAGGSGGGGPTAGRDLSKSERSGVYRRVPHSA